MPIVDCEVWDVVRVAFPYANRPVRQYRPALVVARHVTAGAPALLWVLMITSAGHRRWAGDCEIADLPASGLPAPSMVRTARIATIEAAAAGRIGRLDEAGRRDVRRRLVAAMGLAAAG
jgi:mRNA interferase MazF